MTSSLALLRKDGGEQSANLEAALAEKTAEVTELESELVALSTSKDQTISELNTTIEDLTAQKAEECRVHRSDNKIGRSKRSSCCSDQ